MSRSRNKTIAITMGDPCGIGPEITAGVLARWRWPKGVEFVVIGNEAVLSPYWASKFPPVPLIHVASGRSRHRPGKPTPASGKDSLMYLEHAVRLLKDGVVDALVTAPVSKEAITPFYKNFKGHTSFLAEAFALKDVEMLFIAGALRVVLVTRHVPVKDLTKLITTEKIVAVTRTTVQFLRHKFGLKHPKVAVCGLNPHAGEGGHIGREEITTIIPAVSKLNKSGIASCGPVPADTVFEPRVRSKFDLIVAMYHDQALTALKSQYLNELVNVTAGLPFIRTSPAHGTAFNIAGKGCADQGSMLAAVKLAAELV